MRKRKTMRSKVPKRRTKSSSKKASPQKQLWIGIDNGVSGSIGWVGSEQGIVKVPTFKCLDYQKTKAKNITRVDTLQLQQQLVSISYNRKTRIFLERPMVNPKKWTATYSAVRAHEAMVIVLERTKLPYEFVSSGDWQKKLLRGVKTAAKLKAASKQMAAQLYPSLQDSADKCKDPDGLLIAHWAKRENL